MTLESITQFLENKNWQINKIGDKFLFYQPPGEMGFPSSFLLPVPRRKKAPDFPQTLQETAGTIADMYDISVGAVMSGTSDYSEILRSNAVYFRLSSDNVMFQKTLEINDIWNFFKNLTASYSGFIRIEFRKEFAHLFNADKVRIKKACNKLIELSRLRLVAVDPTAFSFGVAADTLMGRTEIEYKEIQKWREKLIENFLANILRTDFGARNEMERLLERYDEDERKDIFEPIINSVNNSSDFSITLLDKNFRPQKAVKRIPKQIVDIVLPKKITPEKPHRQIGFYQTIIPVDVSKAAIKLRVSDLEQNNLFTQKLDALSGHIDHLVLDEKTVSLKQDISFTVNYLQKEEQFQILIPVININFSLKDFNELQQEFNNQFSTLTSYYLNIKGKPDARSQEIIEYLKSVLPADFF